MTPEKAGNITAESVRAGGWTIRLASCEGRLPLISLNHCWLNLGKRKWRHLWVRTDEVKKKARTVMVEDTEGVAVIITYFLKGKKQQ